MATILKSYQPKPRNVGRKPIYPWDTWLDGAIRRLVQGKDFDCELATMDDNCRKAANSRGKKVHVWREPEKKAIVIQAFQV